MCRYNENTQPRYSKLLQYASFKKKDLMLQWILLKLKWKNHLPTFSRCNFGPTSRPKKYLNNNLYVFLFVFSGKKSIFCLWVHFRRNGYNAGTFFQEKKIALLEQTEWTMAVVSRVECVDIMRYGIRFFWCGVANYLNTVWYGGVKGNAC